MSDLTGAWTADDGGRYFIRQLDDGSVTWAGLHDSGFHLGMEFANVFQGALSADGRTITGEWADVPRGETMNSGKLTLAVEPQPDGSVSLLKTSATGGFEGSAWTNTNGNGQLAPQDIDDVGGRVHRYDKPLADNNPPCRDFSVMWGTVPHVDHPVKLPPIPDDYCSFLSDWDGDGDVTFNLLPDFSQMESDFWTDGWLDKSLADPTVDAAFPANIYILRLFQKFRYFHCEAAMFGRENGRSECGDPPSIFLPAWFEQAGNSVLVNGRPINGRVTEITDGLRFNVGISGQQVDLLPGVNVRVTGVVADDSGHDGFTAPEIHPVYATDILQDFSEPGRAEDFTVNLTGAWHADDVGSYYLRQIGDTVWWLGLSRDQGRTFANVFRGTLSGVLIEGAWVDVPLGTDPILGGGPLSLFYIDDKTTTFVKASNGFFGGTRWTKLYDTKMELIFVSPPVDPG